MTKQNLEQFTRKGTQQKVSLIWIGSIHKYHDHPKQSILEKHGLYAKHMQQKINRSTSFAIDNMYYGVPWCGEIQNQRLKVLGNTFNLHSNSTCAQEVWSLIQFISMCSRENKRVAYTRIHTVSFSYKILYVSHHITDYLIRLAF